MNRFNGSGARLPAARIALSSIGETFVLPHTSLLDRPADVPLDTALVS